MDWPVAATVITALVGATGVIAAKLVSIQPRRENGEINKRLYSMETKLAVLETRITNMESDIKERQIKSQEEIKALIKELGGLMS